MTNLTAYEWAYNIFVVASLSAFTCGLFYWIVSKVDDEDDPPTHI